MPYYNRDPNRDHNFDNHPTGEEQEVQTVILRRFMVQALGFLGSRGLEFAVYGS